MSMVGGVGTFAEDNGSDVRRVGPYRLLEQLGEGGMGIVHLAEHVGSGQRVALKIVRALRPQVLSGMRREIHALASLRHPGIVRILDEGIHQGHPWYAMELLEGRSLGALSRDLWTARTDIASSNAPTHPRSEAEATTLSASDAPTAAHPPIPRAMPRVRTTLVEEPMERRRAAGGRLDEVLTIVRRLCEPLAFLHGEGLVHRDLKPANVLIRHDASVVLVDFGLAVAWRGDSGREVLDLHGDIVGTVGYMSPEHALGEAVDARSDLYALGCMLYELVTGRLPFTGESPAAIVRRHISDYAPPLSHWVADVPPALEEIVARLLAKNPRHRFGHAEDLAAALEPLVRDVERVSSSIAPRPYLYRPALAGRDAALDELLATVRRARDGEGSFVVVGGESGIGKTHLVSDVARQARDLGFDSIALPCARGSGSALHPFVPLLDFAADRTVDMVRRGEAPITAGGARILSAVHPALESIIPGTSDVPLPVLPAQAAQRRLLETLSSVITRLASDRPLLLVVDDLQWADEVTVSFLATRAATFFASRPVLVMATYRSEERTAGIDTLLALPHVRRTDLGKLDGDAVTTLVADMLAQSTPPAPLVSFVRTHANGNPFFVAEYLRSAVIDRVLVRDHAGRWHVTGGDDAAAMASLPVPRSVGELVDRRLRSLGENGRAIVEAAAVLGRDFDAETLFATSALDDARALEGLHEVLARQVLETIADGSFAFLHDTIRSTAYARIGGEARRNLHRRAGRAIESRFAEGDARAPHFGQLADHFERGDLPIDAVGYLDRAGDRALRAFANHEALAYLQRAESLDERFHVTRDVLTRASRLRRIGEAYLGLGQPRESRDVLVRAVELLESPLPVTKSSVASSLIGEIGRQVAHRLAPDRFVGRVDRDATWVLESARAYDLLMQGFYTSGDPLPILHSTLRTLNLAERAGPSAELATAYANAHGTANIMGLHGLATRYAQLARDVQVRVGDRAVETWILLLTGVSDLGRGKWNSARERLESGARIASELGFAKRHEESVGTLAALHFLRGDFDDAMAQCRAYHASVLRGDLQGMVLSNLGLAQNHLVRGDLVKARESTEAAYALLHTKPGLAIEAAAYGWRALEALWSHDLAAAGAAAAQAAECMKREPPVAYFAIYPLDNVAEVALALAEADRSQRAAVDTVCAALTRFARVYRIAEPRRLLATGRRELLFGRRDRARALIADARDTARDLGMRYDAARAARWLAEVSDAVPVRDSLRRTALEEFERLGAAYDANRVRSLLEG